MTWPEIMFRNIKSDSQLCGALPFELVLNVRTFEKKKAAIHSLVNARPNKVFPVPGGYK
jgi:hypothetical protein